ncbi:Ig-like domain-containing protein, partial [Vibrio metoecus]
VALSIEIESSLTAIIDWPDFFDLYATLHLSDGSSSDITREVNWLGGDTRVAYVVDGRLHLVGSGTTTLTASKDGLTSNIMQVEVTMTVADLLTIEINPSSVSVSPGRTQQLVATAKYSDGNEIDVSHLVAWNITDSNIAQVSTFGLLTGNTKGDTKLTATLDGLVSNTVNINVCDLADACLDIFDTGSGKLFTNSPSVAYLDSIGGSATDDVHVEDGTHGPVGDFYRFDWNNANTLCATYNTKSVGGRTNWRLATFDELKVELSGTYGNMRIARDWPTSFYSWSVTADVVPHHYYSVILTDGDVIPYTSSLPLFASCVSEP